MKISQKAFGKFKINNEVPKNRKSGEFWLFFSLVALSASFLMFILLLPYFQKSRSEISVIFIPRSEKSVFDAERILSNLEMIPEKISFYENLLKSNPGIQDKYSGLSQEYREKSWKKDISSKREGSSSIVKISVKGKNQNEAQTLATAAAKNVIRIAGRYYDIKKDVDFRIIDGPINYRISNFNLIIIIFSIGGGILFSSLIFIVSNFFGRIASRKTIYNRNLTEEPSTVIEGAYKIRKKNTDSIREDLLSKIEEARKKEIGFEKSIAPQDVKKSTAPDNLPFVDEDYFRSITESGIYKPEEIKADISDEIINKDGGVPETASSKSIQNEDFEREPSKEELKRRLNQLLKGKL